MFKTFIKAINRLIERRNHQRWVQTCLNLLSTDRVHSIYVYRKAGKGNHLCVLLWGDMHFKDRISYAARIKRITKVDSVLFYNFQSFRKSVRYSQVINYGSVLYTAWEFN